MVKELDASMYKLIVNLCEQGDVFAENGKYEDALVKYREAFRLIPEPFSQWDAATWILAAIGDACFLMGDLISAHKALQMVMSCPNAIGNPFLHLRLGQVLFDLNDHKKAADELARAYMGAGSEIFQNEDVKHISFLKTVMRDID